MQFKSEFCKEKLLTVRLEVICERCSVLLIMLFQHFHRKFSVKIADELTDAEKQKHDKCKISWCYMPVYFTEKTNFTILCH